MNLDQLTIADAVFLHGLLVQEAGVEPMGVRPTVVAPSEHFYWLMIEALERRGLITVEQSLLNAAPFVFPRGFSGTRRYRLRADLLLDARTTRTALEALLKGTRRNPALRDQRAALWVSLGMAELHGYMEWELAIHHFEAAWTDELYTAFDFGLSHFSIAQMFYFCWTGVRDLASHHLRSPGPVDTYRTYLAQGLTNKLKRALRESWQVRQYNRQWRRPPSTVVDTFAGPATGLGERFLILPPSREAFETLF